jgi:hypothetical protein
MIGVGSGLGAPHRSTKAKRFVDLIIKAPLAEALPPLQALGGGARVAEVTIGEEVRLYHENES